MKKYFVLAAMFMAMCFVPSLATAQDATTSATAQVKPDSMRHPRMEPEKMIDYRVGQMAMQLNLTADQQTALKKLMKEMGPAPRQGRRGPRLQMGQPSQTQRDSMRTAMKERRQEYDAQLKKMLTTEQYKQYQEFLKKNRENMQNRRRDGRQEYDAQLKKMLTTEQYKQYQEFLKKNRENMQNRRREDRQEYDAQLKKMLTSEQYKQYQEFLKKNRENMQNRRRDGRRPQEGGEK